MKLRNVTYNTLILAKHWLTKTIAVSQVYQSYEASHAKTEMSGIRSLWDMGGKYQKKKVEGGIKVGDLEASCKSLSKMKNIRK